jgi:indole-3-glycerol phosphate synthase
VLLDDIVAATKVAVEAQKRQVPFDELIRQAGMRAPALNFASALSGDGVKIIAEVKKSSPSKGVIKADFDPVSIAQAYASGGAAAISVLTEEKYFQGSLGYLKAIADDLGENRPPLLRKDFITDPYQVYEARFCGADAVLLIAAILSPSELASLLELTHILGMAALVEAHNEQEINEAVGCGAKIIGINNRDLKTFKIDLLTTARLRPLVPGGRLIISESGISSSEDIDYLKNLGVNAALIGEALMTAPDIGRKLTELTG